MPRIRSIKPEFWADEKLSLLDPLTRLVFLGLICMADDAGRLVDNVKLLDGQLFPATDDTVSSSLETLASIGRILRYRSGSSQDLIQIARWAQHQRVDHPSPYTLPGPETAVLAPAPVPSGATSMAKRTAARLADADSATPETVDTPETLARPSRSDHDHDLRSTINDQTITITARALSIRANQGLERHPETPQRIPRIIATSGRSHSAARTLLEAGVPLAFAEQAVYELATTHRAEREIRSLTYFIPGVLQAWAEQREADSARATAPLAPRATGVTSGTRASTRRGEVDATDPDVWKRAGAEVEEADRQRTAEASRASSLDIAGNGATHG